MPLVVKGASGHFVFSIANGASKSAAVDLNGAYPKYIIPVAGTEGTHVKFYRVINGIDYPCQSDAGVLLIASLNAGYSTELNSALLAGSHEIKIETCSASDGTAQVQTGATTIIIGVV